MIQFNQVYKVFPKDRIALYDLSFRINLGEMVFIVGPSGAGKTVLLQLASMQQFPSRGSVITLDYDSASIKKRQIAELRRKLGLIFPTPRLMPERTVFENVALPLRIQGQKGGSVREKVVAMLTRVGLAEQIDKFPGQLAAGEQQRAALARALVHDPSLVVADEPIGPADDELTRDMLTLLAQFNAAGTTVIVATHHRQLIEPLAGRIIELDKGRLVFDWKAKDDL
jgi:cell division transport system ATP-binding protein